MDIAEIKKLYFLPVASEKEFQEWMQIACNVAYAYLKDQSFKIHGDINLVELESMFSQTSPPKKPEGLAKVFAEVQSKVIKHSVRLSNPRYIGHMTGALPYFAFLAEILTAALNQNVVKIETALSASFVERQTLAWLHRMLYHNTEEFYKNNIYKVEYNFGNTTNGGTMGNLTALTVARNLLLPSVSTEGLLPALKKLKAEKLVILASNRVHYSIQKSASIIGIGSDNVHKIPVDKYTNCISISALEQQIVKCKQENSRILAIVGIAGSTETGNIDDLQALGKICAREKIWFHVDAAWGGSLIFSPTGKQLLQGIELADSVVIDGHKLFYLPMNHGAVLFKNPSSLNAILHSANYIIRPGSVDLGRTSLEGSRRFDAFKLWFYMKTLGKDGYATLMENSLSLAKSFSELILGHPSFTLTSKLYTNILTYRYVPACWKQSLGNYLLAEDPGKSSAKLERNLQFVNTILNEINTDIQKQQRRNGKSFVSRTTLESVFAGSNLIVLRAVLFNPLTTPENLQEILAEQELLGNELFTYKWSKISHLCPADFASWFSLPTPTNL